MVPSPSSTHDPHVYHATIGIVSLAIIYKRYYHGSRQGRERATLSSRDPEIGDLEADVLKTLKRLGSASAGEMMEELRPGRVLAYTTVSTTLDRLHKKGIVSRKSVSGRTGQKYVYSFPGNPGLEKQVVNRMVDRLVSAFGPSVASTIYDRLSEVSPDEAAKLRETVDAKVKQRRVDGKA
ncbi:MAG: BlaI/MecI/CopY family transcriptional regulator [Thaumarchaeota archaeon]|nr:BlaI/MecI/CopY family transcriptional regulator [Nitrososphaerota archaeon]